MTCRGCRKDNTSNRRYCGGCGHGLTSACAACGFGNASDDRYCGGCGTAMGVRSIDCLGPLPDETTELAGLFERPAPPPPAALPKTAISQDDLDRLFGDCS
ncbi:MAG: zinc ribbon domain-containing protein [Deltaproteobacteria bacterium]|nr:zinc ribbon domain-containing protein [Deltaproteobacteria bacterium]